MAELGALKTLSCLKKRISEVYNPGVIFNIRLEDISAAHLFVERAEEARKEAYRYTQDFMNAIIILGLDDFIKPVPESMFITEEAFNEVADEILQPMSQYITSISSGHRISETFEAVKAKGWKGALKPETFEYYLGQYNKLYPSESLAFKLEKMARYFAGALARSILGLRGEDKSWGNNFIDLSFVANPPGTDTRFGKRVIYRTLPKKFTSNHIPPWRSKGFLEIDPDGGIVPKLCSFNNLPDELTSNVFTLKNSDRSVNVQMDYIEK